VIIAIANQKGGVAKTTTTICLGGLLAVEGRTLAIDFDPQGNLTTGLKIEITTEPTSYEVITERVVIKEAIASTVAGLDLVPADINLAQAEPEIISKIGDFSLL
jgi:chromosome partitioning protein